MEEIIKKIIQEKKVNLFEDKKTIFAIFKNEDKILNKIKNLIEEKDIDKKEAWKIMIEKVMEITKQEKKKVIEKEIYNCKREKYKKDATITTVIKNIKKKYGEDVDIKEDTIKEVIEEMNARYKVENSTMPKMAMEGRVFHRGEKKLKIEDDNKGYIIYEDDTICIKHRGNIVLNSSHYEVLESILAIAKKNNDIKFDVLTGKDGTKEFKIECYCSLYELAKMIYKGKVGGGAYANIKDKITNIFDTSVVREDKRKGKKTKFHILRAMTIDDKKDKNNKYTIIFTHEYITYFLSEKTINYFEYIPKIMEIKNLKVREAIRYILSHEEIKIDIDTLAFVILTQEQQKKIKKEPETEDEKKERLTYLKIKNKNKKTIQKFIPDIKRLFDGVIDIKDEKGYIVFEYKQNIKRGVIFPEQQFALEEFSP